MFFIAKAAGSQQDTFAKVCSEFAKVMFFFGERFNDTFLHETPAKDKTWGLRKIRESKAKVTY